MSSTSKYTQEWASNEDVEINNRKVQSSVRWQSSSLRAGKVRLISNDSHLVLEDIHIDIILSSMHKLQTFPIKEIAGETVVRLIFTFNALICLVSYAPSFANSLFQV